jgi:hypothetical protein
MQSMPTTNNIEHFVTLFDNLFLPVGLALHSSLMKHAQPFKLWIVCMDKEVERNLAQLNLDFVSLIPIEEVETPELLTAKQNRKRGEYCWTVTPFTPEFVFARAPEAQRVTYIDADVFLFDTPDVLLNEFALSGKHVLLTDHAYDPELDETEGSGRFCVQFMTFRQSEEALQVARWWQARCIEWCYDRLEDGKFGDQKYLDDWPTRFPDSVHVLQRTEKTLAPWNVRMFSQQHSGKLTPAIYHFQSLRFVKPDRIRLYKCYPIPKSAQRLYVEYTESLVKACSMIKKIGGNIPFFLEKNTGLDLLRHWKTRLLGHTRYGNIPK